MPAPQAAIAVVAVGALLCAGAGAAEASPLEMFGFGGRSTALAGTGVASSDGYESVYLNPAGLARVPRKKATVGFLDGNFLLKMDGKDSGTASARGLVIGGELPMPLGGPMKDRLGLGFGFYVPAIAINRARAPFPGTPEFVLLENRSHVIALQVATGFKLRPGLDLGFGILALAALKGGITVTTDAAGRFTTTSEQRLVTKFAPVLGVRWRARDGLDLGAVVRASSRSDYDIEIKTDIADVVPIALPPIRIAGNAQFDPLTAAVEAAWRARRGLLLSGQLQWQHWSAFPLPTQNPVAGTPAQDEPGFHDTVVPRVSAELTHDHGVTSLALRGGAAFFMSPAPAASGRQSFLDNHRIVVTAGGGLSWPRSSVPLFLDGWIQVHQLLPRRHTKDASVFGPGDEIPFDVLDTGGHIIVGGVTVGLAL
jgi:long-chain fatty acid transport protein